MSLITTLAKKKQDPPTPHPWLGDLPIAEIPRLIRLGIGCS
jgi:hypothetical protein